MQQIIGNFKNSLPILISIAALILSFKAYSVSSTSLIVSNRPYLDIEPTQFEDTNVAVKVAKQSKDLLVTTSVKIINLGKTPAKRIQLYGHHEMLLGGIRLKSASEETIAEGSMAPGRIFRAVYGSHFLPPTGISIDQFANEVFEAMKMTNLTFTCVAGVKYFGDLEPGKPYLTEYTYEQYINDNQIKETKIK